MPPGSDLDETRPWRPSCSHIRPSHVASMRRASLTSTCSVWSGDNRCQLLVCALIADGRLKPIRPRGTKYRVSASSGPCARAGAPKATVAAIAATTSLRLNRPIADFTPHREQNDAMVAWRDFDGKDLACPKTWPAHHSRTLWIAGRSFVIIAPARLRRRTIS